MTIANQRFIIKILFLVLFISISVRASEGFAEINGTRLHYEIKGKGRTVVLIHGGLADSRLWDDQFAKFSKNFRVIRYDLRGFGKSDFPAGAFSHVEDLYALLKFLKVEKVSLVGLSLGGIIAADFTLEYPETVEALVLTASGLRGDKSPRNEKSIAVYKTAEEQGMEKAIELWMEHPYFASGVNNHAYVRRLRQMLADNYKYWGPTPEPIQETWSKQLTIERLPKIKIPTLIIVGDKDAAGILSIADTLQTRIPSAKKIVIAGVSHHLTMEKPRKYNRVVLKFLKQMLGNKIVG
ncbi:MAG: alpha/beta hydrolase [Acidobacteria bacterium]|jgi:pimeloyl-ACP methyl ester carboxylesterase|nr:alpha/beta hydrolase [Acidobacteriota bacterium]MBA4124141.1 alpha/beta hydrolase [Acidobacteriota bacterium]